jgi:UDP-N-acetyl-2-amino-2-deoxyglucuronate dehydrogenase
MALTKAGCEKILYEALHQHKQVFCVMQNRYSPPSQWLKNILREKLLGQIFIVQINCYWNRDDRYYTKNNWHGTKVMDGGTLFTQFSHFIDIMYWLFGDITNIQARFKDFNHHSSTEFEDSGFVNFEFINGGVGSINYSTSVWDSNLESSMTIIGEKGTVKVGGQYMNEVQLCNISNYTAPELPSP